MLSFGLVKSVKLSATTPQVVAPGGTSLSMVAPGRELPACYTISAIATHDDRERFAAAELFARVLFGATAAGEEVFVVRADRPWSTRGRLTVVARRARAWRRGWFWRREEREEYELCAAESPAPLLDVLGAGQLTNDTLFAVLGIPESVRRWFETAFLFDVECNPVNEEVLLRETSITVSRGWDGDELQFRATGAPERWSEALSREAAELGHVLDFR